MICYVFFFKQKPAYELRISDVSSDVCSSDLPPLPDVTTMISAKGFSPGFVVVRDGAGGGGGGVVGEWSLQHRDLQLFVFQPDLHRLAVQFLDRKSVV